MFFQGFFRVALGFTEGFFGLFPRDFLGFFRVCVKSAENQDCRSADSPQRVIKHVRGFANPGTSSYNISQHSGRPQSTVRVTQNEVLDNHPKRVWGMAQVLAVILLHQNVAQCSRNGMCACECILCTLLKVMWCYILLWCQWRIFIEEPTCFKYVHLCPAFGRWMEQAETTYLLCIIVHLCFPACWFEMIL